MDRSVPPTHSRLRPQAGLLYFPRWLDDELHGKGWVVLGAVLLSLVAVAWLLFAAGGREAEPARRTAAAPVRASQAGAAIDPSAPLPVVADAPKMLVRPTARAPTGPARCPYEALLVEAGAPAPERACVSRTRMTQTGAVRSYWVDAEGVSRWSLQVDASAGRVIAARLREASGALAYGCLDVACAGFGLGRFDRDGARRLEIGGALLRRLDGSAARRAANESGITQPLIGTKEPAESVTALQATTARPVRAGHPTAVVLNASLTIAATGDNAGLACPDNGLSLVDSDGSVARFCAGASTSVDVRPDGTRRFLFEDDERRSLSIVLAADDSVLRVALDGDAAACAYPACGGVSWQVHGDAADPRAERTFFFAGNSLRSAVAARTTTLNGSVTMPHQ